MKPYENLSPEAYWRSGVTDVSPLALQNIYSKKFKISARDKIGTAGSCFAQHITRYLGEKGYNLIDVEPAPSGLPADQHRRFGYSLFSGRYGNIYTVRQLLQLIQEAVGARSPSEVVWEKDGRFYDALRPNVEPGGLESYDEVIEHRKHHLKQVRQLFSSLDIFIFTLGLTEAWVSKVDQTVFPTAPGVIAGSFDPGKYKMVNFGFTGVLKDFQDFQKTLETLRDGKRPVRYILTVSPVPLTATASERHVLQATVYSKSVLRAVAGALANHKLVDYFPSFEIITNPAARGVFYASNVRNVTLEAVDVVMKSFFSEHAPIGRPAQSGRPGVPAKEKGEPQKQPPPVSLDDDDVICEDALLEGFAK